MFSWITKRLTVANVAMVGALVFAMAGGAYAAKKGPIITSLKQIKPSVIQALKGKSGSQGSAGPPGPAGPQGPSGAEGKAGTNGTNGTNGKSVVAGIEPKGTNCAEGGSNFEVEGSGTKHYACNGKEGKAGESVTMKKASASECPEGGTSFTVGAKTEPVCNGSPWVPNNVLPSGATETGTWGIAALPAKFVLIPKILELEFSYTSISFTVKLTKPLEASKVHIIGPEEGEGEPLQKLPAGCMGNVGSPRAEKGHLCVFENSGINVGEVETVDPEKREKGHAARAGTVVEVHPATKESPMAIVGTWAVTGE